MKNNGKTIRVTARGAGFLSLDELVPLQGGLKKISRENLDRLKRSILRHGFTAPIFIWKSTDNHVIDGHQRILALIELRDEGYHIRDLPVDYIEADSERHAREKLLYITSQYGDIDRRGLDLYLEESGIDISELGDIRLADGEIKLEVGVLKDTVGDDNALSEMPTDIVEGDILQVGRHRILCGDAEKQEDVERLLDGVVPLLMVTDPPYGVEYDPAWRAAVGRNDSLKKLGTVENDDRANWLDAWRLFPGEVAYVWHAGIHTSTVADSLTASGFSIRAQIIWAKDRFPLSRGHYHWQHEPCWYAVRAKSNWNGDRKNSTLWNIAARDDDGHGHGTQKPVECMRRPIANNSSPGQVVYDPFLGSGTTLIAAEKENRVCYGIDLKPVCVDMAVRRFAEWASLNGIDAPILKNGEPYEFQAMVEAT